MADSLRSCLPFILLVTMALPATAQLIDPATERSTQQETSAVAPAPNARPVPGEKPVAGEQSQWGLDNGLDQPQQEPPFRIARQPTEVPAPPAEERNELVVLFLSLLAVGVSLFIAERGRGWITTNVPLRRILGALVFMLRIAGFGLVLAILLEVVPSGQKNWVLWTLAILALVVGWSVRDLFADVVAGAILAGERRVKKGMWVSGTGFQGTVEGRSLRATWLRDGQGHRLTVPNRAMVGAPMIYDAGADAEHEVVVRLEGYVDAGKVRLALTDAILSSPWVLAGAAPVVLRDPADPVVWRVRTKLLEPRFSVHFEGELLERVEDLLRYVPELRAPEPLSTDVPDES